VSRNELALAYELRQAGCSYKVIAIGLGVSLSTLWRYILRAEIEGLGWLN
jgi:DNA invertase Pin-like site-specific DNA recombinase